MLMPQRVRMEAHGGAAGQDPNKDVQKPLKSCSSGELSPEASHNPSLGEERAIPLPLSGLLHLTDRRQPLSSVSSLEVHFDLLDLTELTDVSDQELAEVFGDSDEEKHIESPAGLRRDTPALQPHSDSHLPGRDLSPLGHSQYMYSTSWTQYSKSEPTQDRDRQHKSDSEE
ncbi:dysbindin domain-containing protein 1 isoform X2 [Paramormyrops kingsleyae]|uniref:dysbindin domain-containing protein 1 isoform X2 n=1 Tax=Paramormyrops kingsleyae TaxID=1676925 RepID=UPI000CD60255|nr:dysbindin domain-containing protein 1-like isoform X2 [Paramormyrops kingsleyae]